jgi:hypothetical protein
MSACLYGTKGRALLLMNQPAEALDAFRGAMAEAEMLHAGKADGNLVQEGIELAAGPGDMPWHDEVVDLLLRLGRTEEAARVAFKRSSLAHVHAFEFLPIPATGSPESTLLSSLRAVRGMLAGSETALSRSLSNPLGRIEQTRTIARQRDVYREQEKAIIGELVSSNPLARTNSEARPPDLSTLVGSLRADTSLVVYGATSRALELFVLSRTGVVAASVSIDKQTLSDLCDRFSDRISRLNMSADSGLVSGQSVPDRLLAAESDSLFDLFVRPVERYLGGAKSIGLVFPRNLPFVPIHAIRRNNIQGTSLIEQAMVWYQSVPGKIEPGSPKAVKDIVTLGHAGTSGRDIEYELHDVKAYFKDARLYLADKADPGLLNTEHGDLIQLGAQTQWDEWHPSNSVVTLADPQSGIGREFPVLQLATAGGFPGALCFNFLDAPGSPAMNLPAVFESGGMTAVVVNGLYSGRKSNKVFSEAFFSSLQGGAALPEAYRSAVLSEIRSEDARMQFWMGWVLHRRVGH